MAKKRTATATAEPPDEGQTEIEKAAKADEDIQKHVKASDSDEDVVEWDEQGCELFFDFEDFRALDGVILDKLSRKNLDRYFVEMGLWRRKTEGEQDRPRLNIQVLGGSAQGRLRVDGLSKDLHPYWGTPQEVDERRRQGYVTVDGRFPEVVAGDKSAGGARKIRTPDGRDELVLMACPKSDYEARLGEAAEKSVGRQRTIQDGFSEKAKKVNPKTETHSQKTVEKVTMKG